MISVGLPAYKTEFLERSIESILNQTYSDFELIIVDDHSPEDVKGIVNQFNDDRIRYFRNEKNLGMPYLTDNWNECLKYANGEYFVLFSDDDIYEPDFLEELMLLATKYPNTELFHCRVAVINEDDEDSFGSYTATINYTNNDSWLAEILVTDIGLENGDRDTPERIKLYIQYEDDIWKGKVMTYHPYADNPPLAPSMNIYTDFIANDDVVKANIYFIDDAQDSLLNLSDYAVGRVKENYPAFSGVSYATSHPNPLVMLANSSTWGSDGLASLTEIANSNYLSDTLWITPFDFKNLSDLNVR